MEQKNSKFLLEKGRRDVDQHSYLETCSTYKVLVYSLHALILVDYKD